MPRSTTEKLHGDAFVNHDHLLGSIIDAADQYPSKEQDVLEPNYYWPASKQRYVYWSWDGTHTPGQPDVEFGTASQNVAKLWHRRNVYFNTPLQYGGDRVVTL